MGGFISHTDNLSFHKKISVGICVLICLCRCMCAVHVPVNVLMLSVCVFTIMHAGMSVGYRYFLSALLAWALYTEVNLKRMSKNPHRMMCAMYY